MFCDNKLRVAALVAALINYAAGHGTITAIQGANGMTGAGFGIVPSTPRNGILPVPFEQDTSVIRDNEISSGKVGPCGRTAAGGNNDVASQLAAASSSGLPTAASDGTVTMTVHQVNQDGAGPYTCDVSADGGATFAPATVTKNVPGIAGLSLAAATDFPLTAQMPAGMKCTGGPTGDACIMRCRNPAAAGPFGSCVAVGNANTSTAVAVPAAAPAVAAAPAAGGAGGALGGILGGAGGAGAAGGILGSIPGLGGGAGGILGKIRVRSPSPVAMTSDGRPIIKRLTTSRIAGKRAGYWIDA